MRKNCEICGKFMEIKYHGACSKCLNDLGKLPPNLQRLYEDSILRAHEFTPKERKSIRGIIRSALTIVCDGDWYAVRWDPMSNLRKVLETADERPYVNVLIEEEIREILEDVNNKYCEAMYSGSNINKGE